MTDEDPRSEFEKYVAARDSARGTFGEVRPSVLQAFEVSIQASRRLGAILTTKRDGTGHSHVSLAPFFLIFERQVFAAFEALTVGQAYQAWVGIRPGIESVLIMGKWVQDPQNAEIWANRLNDPRPYQKQYQGKALGKSALHGGGRIQTALKNINDRFVHPNPYYYYRHLALRDLEDGDVEMRLEFFDSADDVSVGILGVLHLVSFTQDALADMFCSLFPETERLDVGLDSLHKSAGDWARELAAKDEALDWVLKEVGLWPAELLAG